MNFKITLALFVTGFAVFCGWLVVDSGLFENCRTIGQPACILLQKTATSNIAGEANEPAFESAQLRPSEAVAFCADNAESANVTIGSLDPKSGFRFQLELSSKGAGLRRATFSEFDDRNRKTPKPLNVITPVHWSDDEEILSMANGGFMFVRQQQQLPLNKLDWKSSPVVTAGDGSQSAGFEAVIKTTAGKPVLKLVKTYRVFPRSYQLDCTITVENLLAEEQKIRFDLVGPAGIDREDIRSDDRKAVGGFITSDGKIVSSRKGLSVVFPENLLTKSTGLKDSTREYQNALQMHNQARVEKAQEDVRLSRNLPSEYSQAHFVWAAATNRYFAAILRPVPEENKNYCDWVTGQTAWYYNPDGDRQDDSGDEAVAVNLEVTAAALSPAGQDGCAKQYNFQLYLGPKDKSLFDKNELYRKLGFFHTIDFMPCCCCPSAVIDPLAFGVIAMMGWMYRVIPNYGIVIIILVFLIRLVLHPITKKSQVAMSKMTKLGPRAEEIKKKYADNRVEMNKQMMALYKEHGASPVMSFLPMMVQLPIWIALYSAIYASVALRGAAFLPFWITDLSSSDALFSFPMVAVPLLGKLNSFNLLPILMAVAFYLQQKLTPTQTSADPHAVQQQKIMSVMMTALFPLMLYNAPSGLNLYIMASTFAGVVEQYVIKKHIREKEQAQAAGLVSVTSKTGGKVKKKKPKPFFKKFLIL